MNGLGIDPTLLPLSRVRFDVMHLSMNVTRRLLNHLEQLVSRDYHIAGYRLETKMLEFLSFDQLYMWKESDGASKFEGNDLRLFTHNFVNLSDWFREKSIIDVSGSNEWDSFLQALSIWPSINRFLIEQRADSDYEDRINEFEKEVELF